MRILLRVFLLLLVATVNGFVLPTRNSPRGSSSFLSSSSTPEETDDYDDWYADFDPSEYENVDSSFSSYGNAGHDYTRDVDADDSNIDVSVVNDSISERLQYRKTGRFQEADAIRDVLLKEYEVAIYDREKVWRTGCSTCGSGLKWRPNNNPQRRPNNQRRRRDFGPNGHDYKLLRNAGPNVSSLSDEEIHALLAERLQYKMSRDFESADAIQDELIQSGVYVHDGNKEYRADGQGFGDSRGRPGRQPGSRSDRNAPYQQAAQSLPTER